MLIRLQLSSRWLRCTLALGPDPAPEVPREADARVVISGGDLDPAGVPEPAVFGFCPDVPTLGPERSSSINESR